MEPHSDLIPGEARAAASLLMLRDGAPGLQVFMVKRHGLSDVLGGAYVFPGGKVDRDDSEEDALALLDQAPAQLHAALGEPDLGAADAAGLYVAALREAFEETGVLFAPAAQAAEAARATALAREGRSFTEVLALLGLGLQASRIAPWSRWITPRIGGVVRKRFDTRFFVAPVPQGQEATHDNHEATESAWLAPRQALQQYRDGAIDLAPPQIMSLVHLALHADVRSVLDEARRRPPPLVLPEAFEQDGVRVLCYPGDPRHSVVGRALPGPTRLCFREGRFTPEDGFDALFG